MLVKPLKSLISIKDIHLSQIKKLFFLSAQLKTSFKNSSTAFRNRFLEDIFSNLSFSRVFFPTQKVILQAYFEPSTRTKLSFELAAKRIGFSVIHQDFTNSSSSRMKGESVKDSLKVLKHLNPDLLIVRYGDIKGVEKILRAFPMPCINAGGGSHEHPTQALLDLFTVLESRALLSKGQDFNSKLLRKERILFVGDVLHSRVAHSNQVLFKHLGAEIGVCTHPSFFKKDTFSKEALFFDSLKEGLKWATIGMGLRWQKERHSHSVLNLDSNSNFKLGRTLLESEVKNLRQKEGEGVKRRKKVETKKIKSKELKAREIGVRKLKAKKWGTVQKDLYSLYQFNQENLKHFTQKGLLLHSGPVLWGEEMSSAIEKDPRLKINHQVLNGLYVRMSLLLMMLLEKK